MGIPLLLCSLVNEAELNKSRHSLKLYFVETGVVEAAPSPKNFFLNTFLFPLFHSFFFLDESFIAYSGILLSWEPSWGLRYHKRSLEHHPCSRNKLRKNTKRTLTWQKTEVSIKCVITTTGTHSFIIQPDQYLCAFIAKKTACRSGSNNTLDCHSYNKYEEKIFSSASVLY